MWSHPATVSLMLPLKASRSPERELLGLVYLLAEGHSAEAFQRLEVAGRRKSPLCGINAGIGTRRRQYLQQGLHGREERCFSRYTGLFHQVLGRVQGSSPGGMGGMMQCVQHGAAAVCRP